MDVYDSSAAFNGGSFGMVWTLTRGNQSIPASAPRRYTNAVAVAGMMAAEEGIRVTESRDGLRLQRRLRLEVVDRLRLPVHVQLEVVFDQVAASAPQNSAVKIRRRLCIPGPEAV